MSRPGYGGSTNCPPGLATVGHDCARLADALGIGRFAVLGASGGGPYAVAAAAVEPDRVTALGVAAGIGQWPEIEVPSPEDADERRLLAMAGAGDVDLAMERFQAMGHGAFDAMLALDDEEMLDEFFSGAPAGTVKRSEMSRRIWAADLREALSTYDGYVRDNLSFGMPWDVDPATVGMPAYLWYGLSDQMVPATHGRWLADQIPDATLELRPHEGHGDTTFGHWPEMFAALLS